MKTVGLNKKRRKFQLGAGQTLVELVVALTVGAVLVVAAVQSLVGALQSNVQNVGWQGAAHLSQDWLDKITEITAKNWHNLYDLPKGSGNPHRISVSGTDLIFEPGATILNFNNVDYTVSFYVEDTSDLSVEKVTVSVSWSAGATSPNLKIEEYLARSANRVFDQSDWSNGSNCGVLSQPFADYCSKSANLKVGGGRITIE